jgi:Fur family peroxide stress response transcriptional regulator
MQLRNTKQRSKILEILQGTTSHPTANWIYDKAKVYFPNISMGTVYRNLGLLEEVGKIQRLSCGSAFDRYDANTKPHIHFVCKSCEDVSDIHDENPSNKLREAIAAIDLQIDMYDLTCYGICMKCKNNNKIK